MCVQDEVLVSLFQLRIDDVKQTASQNFGKGITGARVCCKSLEKQLRTVKRILWVLEYQLPYLFVSSFTVTEVQNIIDQFFYDRKIVSGNFGNVIHKISVKNICYQFS